MHRTIADAFDAVIRRDIDRLIIQCPPQHGKSTLASKNFPAYQIGVRPNTEVISASATATLAEEFGGAVRNKIASPEYQNVFPGVRLVEDTRAKGRWATTDGGGYYAVGIGGQLFGRGGELGIIDDPYSSWEDGQNDISKKRVWDWYDGTFYNRIRPGGAIVVIQHRVAEDDLIGMLQSREKGGGDRWKVVSIPADLNDPPWPERYDRAALERIKANSYLRKWSSLYMQDPAPQDGEHFKREHFRRYTDAPKELNIYMTGDFAVTDDGGDFTEIAVWGVDAFDNLYAIDWWRDRKTSDVWIEQILDFAERYKPLHFIGEAGVIRKAIEPQFEWRMRQRGVFVAPIWMPSNADKMAMSTSFQGLCSMGRVYFPQTEWAERVIDQCLRFPGGRYDDAVDACSLFGRHIANTWKARTEPAPVRVEWDAPLQIKDFFKRAS